MKFIKIAILFFSIIISLSSAKSSFAAQTSGGINWLDPLGYQKPQFVPIAIPDNIESLPQYYVNMSGGSNTNNCTSASTPCSNMRGLAEKNISNLQGGSTAGAVVNVWGSGQAWKLYGSGDKFYGAPGKEIYIRPRPGYTATFYNSDSGGGSDVGTGGAVFHDVIIDGGPNMDIKFTAHSPGDITYVLNVNGYNIWIYRTQAYTASGTSNLFNACGYDGITASSCHDINFINNEFHDSTGPNGNQSSSVYLGGCGCSEECGGNNITIKNNIIRNLGGEGVEINPRSTSDNIVITGNAIHNVGKLTAVSNGGSWGVRPAVTVDGASCGGMTTNAYVMNNLMWDVGGSCVWTDTGDSQGRTYIYNNSCYQYWTVGTQNGECYQGICYNPTPSKAIIRNNVIYDPEGTNPFGSSTGNFTISNNACGSGESCGSLAQTYSTNTFLSTNENDPNFLRIGSSSEAIDHGTNVLLADSYFGIARTGTSDIGADEYSVGGGDLTPPSSPSGLSVN